MRAELGRLVRFGLVGVSNTLLTVALFALLTGLRVPAAPASALAFAAGAVNGYRLNRAWTFRVARGGAVVLARYAAVQALGAGLSAGGVALMTTDLSLRRLAAEAVVLPVVTIITYTLSRRVVFGGLEAAR
jgi:putative flippase GtrA